MPLRCLHGGVRALSVLVAAGVMLNVGCRRRVSRGLSSDTSAAPSALAAPFPSTRPVPASPGFTLVADQYRFNPPWVLDYGERTFLLAGGRARVVAPGTQLLDALDVTAGLPAMGPMSRAFAGGGEEAPLLVGMPVVKNSTGCENVWYRLEGNAWSPMPLEPCVYRALRLGSDTVVIGLLDAPEGDHFALPAGNRTRAWVVRAKDNLVLPWNDWPNTLTFAEQASERVLWAVATRPSLPGKWLLRMAAGGRPAFFAIPSRQACRGLDRYFLEVETLESVDDETAIVILQSVSDVACLKGEGRYRFTTKTNTWQKLGEHVARLKHSDVSADGTTFRIVGTGVVVETRGKVETYPLREVEQLRAGPHPPPLLSVELLLTAGRREVWVASQIAGRSLLYRYEGGR